MLLALHHPWFPPGTAYHFYLFAVLVLCPPPGLAPGSPGSTDPYGVLCNGVGALAEAAKWGELRRALMQVGPVGGGVAKQQGAGPGTVKLHTWSRDGQLDGGAARRSVSRCAACHALPVQHACLPGMLAVSEPRFCAYWSESVFVCGLPLSYLQVEFGEGLGTLVRCVREGTEPAQVGGGGRREG